MAEIQTAQSFGFSVVILIKTHDQMVDEWYEEAETVADLEHLKKMVRTIRLLPPPLPTTNTFH